MSPKSRRSFLRGLGGVMMGVPCLASLGGRARAAEPVTPPKRCVFVFTPCGVDEASRISAEGATQSAFTLGPGLEALAPYQDRLMVVDGLQLSTSSLGPGGAHQVGIGQLLTGTPLLPGGLFSPFDDGDLIVGWGGGISVDQRLAEVLGGSTWLRSLELGVQTRKAPVLTVGSTLSYRGPNQPVAAEDDPHQVFARLFGAGGAAGASLEVLRNKRLSVLDAVHEEFQAVASTLSAEDAQRLSDHADHVRDLELRLQNNLAPISCQAPTPVGLSDLNNPAMYGLVGSVQMDLLTTAFTCDLTRVATLQWSHAASEHVFDEFGANGDGHHTITHLNQTPEVLATRVDIEGWYASRVAELVARLAFTPDGDGTLLDNTLVVWVNEMGEPTEHSFAPMPVTLIGDLQGTFNTGRLVKVDGAPMNNLHLSILNAMGVPDLSFGAPGHSSSALPQLLAG
jgi:hypothetical protein